jgi:thiamine monophosphate kinase
VDTHLDLDTVPFFTSVASRPLQAASAGEDFVLLFGAPEGEDFQDSGYTRVGRAETGEGRVHVRSKNENLDPGSAGYDHFREQETGG